MLRRGDRKVVGFLGAGIAFAILEPVELGLAGQDGLVVSLAPPVLAPEVTGPGRVGRGLRIVVGIVRAHRGAGRARRFGDVVLQSTVMRQHRRAGGLVPRRLRLGDGGRLRGVIGTLQPGIPSFRGAGSGGLGILFGRVDLLGGVLAGRVGRKWQGVVRCLHRFLHPALGGGVLHDHRLLVPRPPSGFPGRRRSLVRPLLRRGFVVGPSLGVEHGVLQRVGRGLLLGMPVTAILGRRHLQRLVGLRDGPVLVRGVILGRGFGGLDLGRPDLLRRLPGLLVGRVLDRDVRVRLVGLLVGALRLRPARRLGGQALDRRVDGVRPVQGAVLSVVVSGGEDERAVRHAAAAALGKPARRALREGGGIDRRVGRESRLSGDEVAEEQGDVLHHPQIVVEALHRAGEGPVADPKRLGGPGHCATPAMIAHLGA